MATYKLWLTVKDSNGNIKEIDGGNVNIDLTKITEVEATHVAEALKLDSYATDQELDDAIKNQVPEVIKEEVPVILETNTETKETIVEVVSENIDTIKYDSFTSTEEEEVGE